MRILFTVQGEGRGHMTQALACHEILSKWGHEIVGVVAGKNSSRSLPSFFEKGFATPVTTLSSPGFVFRDSRSVDVPATTWQTLRQWSRHRNSLRALRDIVKETRPDVLINFFEPLAGLIQAIRPLPIPVIAAGHQYMIHHPDYVTLPGNTVQQLGMRWFVKLVGSRSTRLALSLYEAGDLPERRLVVCPPILRRRLFELTPGPGDYYLVYLLNHGYAEEIIAWHQANQHVKLHCFYDRPGAPEVEEAKPNLTFHRLNGDTFLRMMATCKAVVCTAGFESVSEAAWLGKPLFMVPVENHVEQMINALDAVNLGLGITDRKFRLSLLHQLPERIENDPFRQWVMRAESVLERALTTATSSSVLSEYSTRLQPRVAE